MAPVAVESSWGCTMWHCKDCGAGSVFFFKKKSKKCFVFREVGKS